MKSCIVTGATGAIGLALVQELLQNGKQVTAIVRPGSKRAARLPQHNALTVIECGLDSIGDLYDRMAGIGNFEQFYHLGWDYSRNRDNIMMQLKNITYVSEAISLAEKLGCSCFIGCGSKAEYGRCEGIIDEDTPAMPETAYGIAKLCAAQMGNLQCEKNGIRFIWPRIFSVYGPGGGEGTMIMSVIRQLCDGMEPALTEGKQMWDFLYASDAAMALRLLGENEKCRGIYCLGYGKAQLLRSYVEQIRDCIDKDLTLGFGKLPYSGKQVMNLKVNIQKLREETGFSPKVDFGTGIEKTVEWCKTHPDIVETGNGF